MGTLFRARDTPVRLSPPRASYGPARLLVAAGRRFLSAGRLFFTRRLLIQLGLIVGLVVQLVLLWLLGELVDLCISLMELWAELARKHLELTL